MFPVEKLSTGGGGISEIHRALLSDQNSGCSLRLAKSFGRLLQKTDVLPS